VVAKEIETSEKISQALVEILGSLGRWNKYIELFDEFERVRETAAHLFSQIINFLVRTKRYYSRPRAGEIPGVLFEECCIINDIGS
jgi:hypothetical protein